MSPKGISRVKSGFSAVGITYSPSTAVAGARLSGQIKQVKKRPLIGFRDRYGHMNGLTPFSALQKKPLATHLGTLKILTNI